MSCMLNLVVARSSVTNTFARRFVGLDFCRACVCVNAHGWFRVGCLHITTLTMVFAIRLNLRFDFCYAWLHSALQMNECNIHIMHEMSCKQFRLRCSDFIDCSSQLFLSSESVHAMTAMAPYGL